MNSFEIEDKRRFWRRVLIAGILVLVIALLTVTGMYLSRMADVRAAADSDIEREIAMVAAKGPLLYSVGKWIIPFAILASMIMNVARYKLRKLKKLENQ